MLVIRGWKRLSGLFVSPGPPSPKSHAEPRPSTPKASSSSGAGRKKGVTRYTSTPFQGWYIHFQDMGMGQNETPRKPACFSLWFHLQGSHIGYASLTHSHMQPAPGALRPPGQRAGGGRRVSGRPVGLRAPRLPPAACGPEET